MIILLFNLLPIVLAVLCLSMFWYSLRCILSKLHHLEKEVVLLLLSYGCLAAVNVLWLFLTAPWVGLQCVIVVFPYHTHLFL